MLLVLGRDSMLRLLLHRLHEVLHVLERIDLQWDDGLVKDCRG